MKKNLLNIIKDNNDNDEIKGICILDSAGFETPLLKEEKPIINNQVIIKEKNGDELENAIKFDEIEDELARDKAQTERFIEQLIIFSSFSSFSLLLIMQQFFQQILYQVFFFNYFFS